MASWGALAAEGNASPTFKFYGDVSLLSHYVENGISQSEKTPALQGSFWFNMGPQFRLGLWGSNTNFANSDDRFNLRLNAEIKVDITQKTNLNIAYTKNNYYNGGQRNGSITGVHLKIDDYRILYDNYSNWEGTDESLTRYALGKNTTVWTDWKWNNEVGYNAPTLSSLENYFDLRTGLGTKWTQIFFEGALTATSNSSQLHGSGDLYFILSGTTEF